jgi:hypothetical protein
MSFSCHCAYPEDFTADCWCVVSLPCDKYPALEQQDEADGLPAKE